MFENRILSFCCIFMILDHLGGMLFLMEIGHDPAFSNPTNISAYLSNMLIAGLAIVAIVTNRRLRIEGES